MYLILLQLDFSYDVIMVLAQKDNLDHLLDLDLKHVLNGKPGFLTDHAEINAYIIHFIEKSRQCYLYLRIQRVA